MKKLKFILVFILCIFYPLYILEARDCLRIHFIDAAEGESILIETPKGRTILIDSGNCITGFRVAEYLKKGNIYTLDHLIFTHPDLDHICGAFFVLQMLKAKNIYDNGQDLTEGAKSSDIYRWHEELVRKDKGYKTLRAKDTISLDGITLRVLWPPQPLPFSDYNANSLVIMMEYGKFRCLLAGDLNTLGEKEILKVKDSRLKADVLKIGHHGASDSNCEEFLTAVSPKIGIISVNKANIRGYPSGEVSGRLKKARVELYRTDKDGDIILNIYQTKFKEYKIQVNKTQ